MVAANEVLFITDEDSQYLFDDLLKLDGVKEYIIRKPSNEIVNLIRRIHINPRISKILWLPKRDIWFGQKYIINNIPKDGYLIVNSSVMTQPSTEFWITIRKKRPDAKFVLILVDSMHVIGGHMPETRKRIKTIKWDKVLSYDKKDCLEFGFEYIGFDYYSPACIGNMSSIYDLYYVSSVKAGRTDTLRKLNAACKEQGVNNLFQIVSSWRKIDYGKCIRQNIPYKKVLENVAKTNCILEILQKGQNTQSIRYLEALCYKKKLLTNNPDVVDYPYYDSRYMKYFKTVEEIDWDWVKKREEFNYGEIDFSSAKLLRYI